jgi:hypothetical protein
MKATLILLTVLTAGTLAAQPLTKAPKNEAPKKVDHAVKTDVLPPAHQEIVITSKPEAANSVAGHKVVYSGVAVQVAKARHPLQLLNPFAPAEYGTGHENLDRDIITGKVTGFKLISVNF